MSPSAAQPAPAGPPPAVPAAHSAPASPTRSSGSDRRQRKTNPGCTIVKSPIVGTFYESASPGAPPFVKIGDKVSLGQVLCIVEAMKLMNEIESDHAGEPS